MSIHILCHMINTLLIIYIVYIMMANYCYTTYLGCGLVMSITLALSMALPQGHIFLNGNMVSSTMKKALYRNGSFF